MLILLNTVIRSSDHNSVWGLMGVHAILPITNNLIFSFGPFMTYSQYILYTFLGANANQIDEIITGAVLTAGHGQNISRQIAIKSGNSDLAKM